MAGHSREAPRIGWKACRRSTLKAAKVQGSPEQIGSRKKNWERENKSVRGRRRRHQEADVGIPQKILTKKWGWGRGGARDFAKNAERGEG